MVLKGHKDGSANELLALFQTWCLQADFAVTGSV